MYNIFSWYKNVRTLKVSFGYIFRIKISNIKLLSSFNFWLISPDALLVHSFVFNTTYKASCNIFIISIILYDNAYSMFKLWLIMPMIPISFLNVNTICRCYGDCHEKHLLFVVVHLLNFENSTFLIYFNHNHYNVL